MIKKILLTIVFLFNAVTYTPNKFVCASYCLMDANSLEIVESSNISLKRSVASTSKIMTAIIAIESDRLFEVVTVDEVINTIEGSAIYVAIGDQITVIDLLYGLLLRSGNDAAVLLAKYLYGSIESFVYLMNAKARELNMVNTFFNNPTGLDVFDGGNISTSYDMCLLMSYCISNPLFVEISSCKSYTSKLKGKWKNKNKLLFDYDNCLCGKTGYTKKSKRSLVSASQNGNQKLVMCTLNCSNDFTFHKEKYENIYNNYTYILCLKKGENTVLGVTIISKKEYGIRVKNSAKKVVISYHFDDEKNFKNVTYIEY